MNREINAKELVSFLRWAVDSELPNPRVITPELIKWSSLFHPRFFKSVHKDCPIEIEPLQWRDDNLSTDFNLLSQLWLQSVMFLSGVTLSAAIIQHRFSSGTIGSKLDRLWDAGSLSASGLAKELNSLRLHDRVSALASDGSDEIVRLLAIRETYMEVMECIAPRSGKTEMMRQSSFVIYPDGRFDFIKTLRNRLGSGLRAVVVYGSSVSSDKFADIDAVVIVDDPTSTLLQLAGTSPTWMGKELNLGIYSPSEFLIMQYLSGDNLSEYGVCIWGELEVIRKQIPDLLARNFSFGVVRQRQQFGMLSRELASTETLSPDRKNLYEYFVKIPANVAKGTFGAVGERLPKERIHDWLLSTIGFNAPASQNLASSGKVVQALASSSLATGHSLRELNKALGVVKTADLRDK
ncbi:MAG: hypothetical protein N838_11470 [Thiohalocapsa sp. PB-PSB1]|nr:MAG: hypothetical protein N838_11470 [Thiohalocapsa sp. PB-PSB1]